MSTYDLGYLFTDPIFLALEAERHVVADLNASLSHLQSSLTKIKEKSSALDTELQSERKEVKAMQTEKERQTNVLNDMRERDTAELKQLEEALGWRVEGIKRTSVPIILGIVLMFSQRTNF